MGIEQEFGVYDGDERLEAGSVLPEAVLRSDRWFHPVGDWGFFLDTGQMVGSDAWAAEVATPPLLLAPGASARLTRVASEAHRTLASLIGGPESPLGLRGYSTHWNAHCSRANPDDVCRVYARTMSASMMMLSDLVTSPGLLVRPRRRRFEVGGEYVPADDRLTTATVFFLASYLAVRDAVATRSWRSLPIWLDDRGVERSVRRPGYYVDRGAFGDDLYDRGRRARLRLSGLDQTDAQRALQLNWAAARPYLEALAEPSELALVDAVVSGRRPLPCEAPSPAKVIRWEAPRRAVGAPAERRITESIRGRIRVRPHAVTWDFTVYRVEVDGERSCYASVPDELRRSFRQAFAAGELDEVLVDAARFAEGELHDPRLAEQAGLYRSARAEALQSVLGGGGALKKKTPDPDVCSVTLIQENPVSGPTVEICVESHADTLVPTKPQEAINAPAIEASGVFLHNGAFQHTVMAHTVQAIGFDMGLTLHYRSAVQHDGPVGVGWDHIYHKRVVATPPGTARLSGPGWCETYSGREGPESGDLWFYDGTGRRTYHRFERWEHRTLRKFDGTRVRQFDAVVTTYARNPGERFRLHRVAVYRGARIWGESVYYTRQGFDGSEQIFDCCGRMIAWRDANWNVMRFVHGGPVDPHTGCAVLRFIVDSSLRTHELVYRIVAGVPRVEKLIDHWKREVTFEYTPAGELRAVVQPGGRHPESRHHFDYGARKGLLTEVTSPEAHANGWGSYLQVGYHTDERVDWQRVGSREGLEPIAGGSYQFEYLGPTIAAMTDRRGERVEFELVPKLDTHVLRTRAIVNRIRPVPGIQRTEPARFVTVFEHDDEFQVVSIARPGGLTEFFDYVPGSRSVTVGDERESMDPERTLVDNLARGNLWRHRFVSGEPDRTTVEYVHEYDELLNRVTLASGPLGQKRHEYDNGWTSHLERNGNPLLTKEIPALLPDLSTVAVHKEFAHRSGGLVDYHKDPDGVETTYEYHSNGAIAAAVTDPKGLALTWSFERDDIGRLDKLIHPEKGEVTQGHDNRDNVTWRRDPMGHETRYFYDREDRLVRVEVDVYDDRPEFYYPRSRRRRVAVRTLERDILGQVVAEVVDPDGLSLRREWHYDGEGHPVRAVSPRASGDSPDEPDAIVEYEYESRGLPHRITAAPGHDDEATTYLLYGEAGFQEWTVEPDGGIWSYAYDGLNRLKETTSPVGVVTKFDRNGAGQPTRIRVYGPLEGPSPEDREGLGNRLLSDVFFTHDANDRVVRERTVAFDPHRSRAALPAGAMGGLAGAAAAVALPPGAQRLEAQTWYSPGGRLAKTVDPAGRIASYLVDSAGRPYGVDLPSRATIRRTLDRDGRILFETTTEIAEGMTFLADPPPIERTVARRYDLAGRLIFEQWPDQAASRFAYDSRGLLRAVRKPSGGWESHRYDAAGRKRSTTMAVESNTYNPFGRVRIRYRYDRNGSLVRVRDGVSNVTEYGYDPLDRLRSVTDPDGFTTRADLNGAGDPRVITTRSGNEIELVYDLAGRMTRRFHRNPPGPRVDQRFEMDGLGRITKVTDSGTSEVERRYDSLGHLVREAQDGEVIEARYNRIGNLLRLIYPSGMEVELTPGSSGQTLAIARQGYVLCSYGGVGRRVFERVTPLVLADPRDGSYSLFPMVRDTRYSPSGQLASIAHYVYDDVVDPSDPRTYYLVRPLRVGFDGAGRLESKSSPEFRSVHRYDRLDRLVRSEVGRMSDHPFLTSLDTLNQHDAAGVVREQTVRSTPVLGGVFASTTQTTPTELGGPETIVRSDGAGTETDTIRWYREGHLMETDHAVPDPADPARTEDGVRTFAFDAFGRLSAVGLESRVQGRPRWNIRYGYDAFGRRVLRTVRKLGAADAQVIEERQTRYVFWGDRCIEEHVRAADGDPWRLARRFYHGVDEGEVVAMDVREWVANEDIDNDGRTGEATLAVLDDHDRTPLGLAHLTYHGDRLPILFERYFTRSTGRVDRFRTVDARTAVSIPESRTGHVIHQHGQWLHEPEGLYYVGRRFRDASLGIFISRDPGGSWIDFTSLGNGYTYAGNDGVNASDPTGQAAETIWDAASLGIGVYSISQWDESTPTSSKILDVVGVALDGIALALPFVPGGAGAAIKAYRGIRTLENAQRVSRAMDGVQNAYRAVRLGKQIERGLNSARAVEMGLNSAHGAYLFQETGSPWQAAVAILGGLGAMRSAKAALQGVCFPEGTLIRTPRGLEPIEALEPGSAVRTIDELSGMVVDTEVTGITRGETRSLVRLTFEREGGEGGFVLEATEGHPFLVDGRPSWVAASSMAVGDRVKLLDGFGRVTEARRVTLGEPVAVSNLEVAALRTFLVGEGGVLVHNTCPAEQAIRDFERLLEATRPGFRSEDLAKLNRGDVDPFFGYVGADFPEMVRAGIIVPKGTSLLPGHNLFTRLEQGGEVLLDFQIHSRRMQQAEALTGNLTRRIRSCCTENRMQRAIGALLSPGSTVRMAGQLPPCYWCRWRMTALHYQTGAQLLYLFERGGHSRIFQLPGVRALDWKG